MFTRCPNDSCRSVYRVKAELLRLAMGTVRCPRCGIVFNALSSVTEPEDVGPEDAYDITRQLPYTQRGDRIVLSYRALEQRDWYRRSRAARDAASQPDAARPGDSIAPVQGVPPPQRTENETAAVEPLPATDAAEVESYAHAPLPRVPLASTLLATSGDLGLALRNVVRQGRRSALGLGAITFGVVAMLLAGGFMEWSTWALRKSTILSRLGHVQVVRPGYFERGLADPFAYLLPGRAEALANIEQDPRVRAVAPRLAFSGLVAFGDISVSFAGEGVDADKERLVSSQLRLVKGSRMDPSAPNGILVGEGLAANLAVAPGDTVVLLATTAEGGMNAVEADIRGIFRTSSKAYDDVALRVPLDTARELMGVSGSHKWVVLLDRTEHTDEVVAELNERFPAERAQLEFVPWLALADFYKKTVALFSAQMHAVRLMIVIIIVASISNTLAMSVVERTPEIGTLMAVGFQRRRVLGMFVNEGLVIGLVGGLAGLALGIGLAEAISHVGIPMPPAPGTDFGYRGRILLTWPLAGGGLALAIVATLAASIYPAWKASRLEIVDALRHAR